MLLHGLYRCLCVLYVTSFVYVLLSGFCIVFYELCMRGFCMIYSRLRYTYTYICICIYVYMVCTCYSIFVIGLYRFDVDAYTPVLLLCICYIGLI
jgi:hypothetical protein